MIVVILLGIIYSYGEWPRPIYDTDISSGAYESTGALEKGTSFEQQFICTNQGLCGLSVKLSKMEHLMIGEYHWEIQDAESGEVVGGGIINDATTKNKLFESSSALKRGNIELDFQRQKESAGKKYLFIINSQEVNSNETMAVYLTQKNENESFLKIGNENSDKVGVIKLRYQRFNIETFVVFLGIMVYLGVFIKFIYKLFK